MEAWRCLTREPIARSTTPRRTSSGRVGVGDWGHISQQENIARDTDEEKYRGRAENSEAQNRSADENNLTNANRVPAALYQSIDEPSAYDKIGERRENPGNTGIQRGMKQINMIHGGKIRRQPG